MRHAAAAGDAIDYFLLTDADIGHAPDNLSSLVARAEQEGRVQVSLMAELSCATWPERFLIPAFVYFFQMLYPVRLGRAERSQDGRRRRRMHAGATRCAGARRRHRRHQRRDHRRLCAGASPEGQGPDLAGSDAARHELAPLWRLPEIGRMISRSAYAQLGYSPLAAGRHRGRHGPGLSRAAADRLARRRAGSLGWVGRLAGHGADLPAHAALLPPCRRSGAWRFPPSARPIRSSPCSRRSHVWRGRGGLWKGRVQAMAGDA